MVKKIFNIINREYGGINEAAFLIGLLTFLAQILGLFRDRALASILGPSTSLDIYYAAFRIPDFLYVSIASLASITVLIPFLVEKLNDSDDGRKKAEKFFNDVFTVFLSSICIIAILLAICMPYLAPYLAPGFSADATAQLVTISRIMLLSPIFLGLSNMLGSITQLFHRFFVYALAPVFYNAGILFGIFVFLPHFGIIGLAFGVVVGAILHLGIQLPVIIHEHFLPRWSAVVDFTEIRRVVVISFPRTLTLALNSLTILVLIAFASKMSEGSISIFNFAINLQSVPLGIIGMSYSVAAFPTLVKTFAEKNMISFSKTLIATARQITFWSLPIITAAIVLRAQIVRLVLGSGQFTWTDTRLTAAALAIFSISIFAQSMVLLLVRAYYATGNTKTPLIINIVATIATIFFSFAFLIFFHAAPQAQYVFEAFFRIQGLPGVDIIILALAYSFGTVLNVLIFWWVFKRDFPDVSLASFSTTFFKTAFASIIMGFAMYGVLAFIGMELELSTFWNVFLHGVSAGCVGLIVLVVTLRLLKSEELEILRATLHKKFWKTETIIPEQKQL